MNIPHTSIPHAPGPPDAVIGQLQRRLERMETLAEAYRTDPAVRTRAENEPHSLLREQGLEIPPSTDVRIVANTPDLFHLVMPPDPNLALADEDLGIVAGGKSGGSASTASTAGTAGSTISSAGSAACAGSAS